jgi:tetratricopeptide (TPR) repeat protein
MNDFDEAEALDPLDPTIYFNRGNAHLNGESTKDDRFKLAHDDYSKALSLDPFNAKIWHSKGLAYQSEADHRQKANNGALDKANIDHAIEMFKKALEIQENFVSSRYHLGLMYHKKQ